MAKLKYQLIMEYIKNEIVNGMLHDGDKIYSESSLMKKFNVSRYTVREALKRLTMEGLIKTEQGKGSFVCYEEHDRSIQNDSVKTILVMVSYLNNHIVPEIIQEIERKCAINGYNMLLRCTHNKIFVEKEIILKALQEGVCGVISEPSKTALPSLNKELYNSLRKKGIPVIYIHGCYDFKNDDYVVVDDVKAGYDACMKLIEAGHRNISAIFKVDDIQGHRRYEGMLKALYEKNISINEKNVIWISTEDEKVILSNDKIKEQYLIRLLNTTATICYNDDLAIDIADYLFENGVDLPKEHSLVSFDNTVFGGAYRVPISSMQHPRGEIGRIAFDELIRKMNDETYKCEKEICVEFTNKSSISKI